MTIATIYLAALLAVMAAGQLASWRAFALALAAYGVSRPNRWAASLAAGELASALLLVPSATRVAGAVLALVVALVWTGLAINAFVKRRQVANCGCFGRYLPQPLRWWVLVEDAGFIALAGWVLFQSA